MTFIGTKKYIKKCNKVKCKCGSPHTVKAGFARKKQRYKCNKCQRRFVLKIKVKRDKKKEEFLVQLYLEGLGIRSIARILEINHVEIQRLIKRLGAERKTVRPLYSGAIEIDEIYYYTKKKARKRWLWLAVCKDTKRILGYQTGTRGRTTLKKLIEKIRPIACGHYYTDEHISFRGLLPEKKYTASKRYTTTVEGINSAVRHFLARFRRKSKCYTKSEAMLHATLNLFVENYNERKPAA